MWPPNGSLPQMIYSVTEILSCRCRRHSQILADQFWSRFIKEYLPGLQTQQKWLSSPPNSWIKQWSCWWTRSCRGPWGLIGHIIKIHRSSDSCTRLADMDVKGHVHLPTSLVGDLASSPIWGGQWGNQNPDLTDEPFIGTNVPCMFGGCCIKGLNISGCLPL